MTPMKKRPEMKIRFDSLTQKEKIARAARIRRWSFTKFVSISSEEAAVKILADAKAAEGPTDGLQEPSLS